MSNRLDKLKELKDRRDRTIYFVAILTEALKDYGVTPVLVGGGALEFYTQGNYMTLDIDLVINGREQAKEVLESMGFERLPGRRSWYNEEMELSVEIPDYVLAGSKELVTVVDLGGGLQAYIIGVEDLIIDRLNAYKYWKSLSDGEWATALLLIHFNEVDMSYLVSRAEEDGIIDVLNEITMRVRKQIK